MATPNPALSQADLAWAAGLFDGEGCTIVHSDASRPGYLRLEIIVAQAGRRGVPAVLLRFQSAVGQLSRIVGPERREMYKCISRGRLEAMAIVALLWPYLGEVKRLQANHAIKEFLAQYASGQMPARTGRHARRVFEVLQRTIEPASDSGEIERAWAAGFLDGEGCFGLARSGRRVRGPDWYRLRASATQHGRPHVAPEVLLRLRRALGDLGRIECHGEIDDFKWVAEGDANVEKVLTSVGAFLGEAKTADAHEALAAFRAQVRLKGDAMRCVRGHKYSYKAMRGGRMRRICIPCARINGRRARAKHGVAPRQFKDATRRYRRYTE